MKNYVYVISGEHGRQKIGVSDNPRQRIKELQTGSPFPLNFEFVGEAENGNAGAIEVEAHFTLNQHKAPGGDEWFVVPPDVAVTAVMAAAHRLGYRLKPVDPDGISGNAAVMPGAPWEKWIKVAVALVALYPIWSLIAMLEADRITLLGFAISAAILVGLIKLAQTFAVYAARSFVRAFDTFAGALRP
jgi:hypothetical protein